MNAGQTIGEILAAAMLPVPFDDCEARIIAGRVLAEHIADEEEQDYSDVWKVMTRVDDRLLPLLESPAGWAALSAIVSASLGGTGKPFNPSIH